MTDEAEALESLVAHPGWHLFLGHVEQTWGVGGTVYNEELDAALDLLDSQAAASQARQIRAARRTIQALVQWPADERQRLARQGKSVEPAAQSVMGRRGGL